MDNRIELDVQKRKRILNRIKGWSIYANPGDTAELFLDDTFKADLDEVRTGKKWLILGRKGSGKSALVYEFLSRFKEQSLAHKQDFVPNLLYSRFRHFDREYDPASAADLFKLDILLFAARKLEAFGLSPETKKLAGQISKFYDNRKVHSYVQRALRSGFIGALLNLFSGNTEFGATLRKSPVFSNEDAIQRALEKVKSEMITLFQSQNPGPIFIFFDEIDLALGNSRHTENFTLYMQALNALLAACWTFRDIRLQGVEVYPVVVLRDDIFQSVGTADDGKWRHDAVRISYSIERFEELAAFRLRKEFERAGANPADLEDCSFIELWSAIANSKHTFARKTIWENVLERSFYRPRDFVQIMNLMSASASQRSGPKQISTNDFKKSRSGYAKYFRQELVDEMGYKFGFVDRIEEFLDRVFFPASNKKSFKSTVRGDEFRLEIESLANALREIGVAIDARSLTQDLFDRSVVGIVTGNTSEKNQEIVFKFSDPDFNELIGFEKSFTLHPGIKDYFLMRNRALG